MAKCIIFNVLIINAKQNRGSEEANNERMELAVNPILPNQRNLNHHIHIFCLLISSVAVISVSLLQFINFLLEEFYFLFGFSVEFYVNDYK